MPYDRTNSASIEAYARLLINQTLRNHLPAGVVRELTEWKSKGKFWNLLEEYYFHYQPNSESLPDFPEAGLELKSTPILKRAKWGVRSKERLVLNIINYLDIPREDWNSSSFLRKNAAILLVVYLYEQGRSIADHPISLVEVFRLRDFEEDLEIIRNDWETIVGKIRNGKAHELSESDTMYLAACTKGATAEESYRPQFWNDIKAKQRAFSFKAGYMNTVLGKLSGKDVRYESLFKPGAVKKSSLQELLDERFAPYFGKTAMEIAASFGIDSAAKSRYHMLSRRILGVKSLNDVEEFSKADIELRTIRIKPDGIPKEDISFPHFQFKEIVEQEWLDSDLQDVLERKKFLFVVFRITVPVGEFGKMCEKDQDRHLVLEKIALWNAPGNDIETKARLTWEKTRETIRKGVILIQKGDVMTNNLPKKSETDMVHVRPHWQDKEDVDYLPGGIPMTKQCFWLNGKYLAEQLGTMVPKNKKTSG